MSKDSTAATPPSIIIMIVSPMLIMSPRGHFRAGFAPWFSDVQTIEVDTGGLTSPILDRFTFSHIQRPSFPFDRDAVWIPWLKSGN